MTERFVYTFQEAAEAGLDRNLLGGKGESLVRMTQAGLPVPPGIVITTPAYRHFRLGVFDGWKEQVLSGVIQFIRQQEDETGKIFGVSDLLVSVRSGAPVSMPGMMDTILNVGVSWMLDPFGIPSGMLVPLRETLLRGTKASGIDGAFLQVFKESGALLQIWMCMGQVWRSFNSDRAKEYRNMHNIPDNIGTAIVIQRMVLGLQAPGTPKGSCGSGVYFTRNPMDGGEAIGEILIGGQGEAVVGGSVTPESIDAYQTQPWYGELKALGTKLEAMYGDAMDVEFTVENGKLWLLQCRPLVMANPNVQDTSTGTGTGKIKASTSSDNTPKHIELPEGIAPLAQYNGKPIGGGHGVGVIVYTPEEAASWRTKAVPYVYVKEMTDTHDLKAMRHAAAVVTMLGGTTCHAAIVARGSGIPTVVGVGSISWDRWHRCLGHEGCVAFVDADTGRIALYSGEALPMEWLKSVYQASAPESALVGA